MKHFVAFPPRFPPGSEALRPGPESPSLNLHSIRRDRRVEVGMFLLILAVLNRDYSNPPY